RVAFLIARSMTAAALSASKSPGEIRRTSCKAAVASRAYALGMLIVSILLRRRNGCFYEPSPHKTCSLGPVHRVGHRHSLSVPLTAKFPKQTFLKGGRIFEAHRTWM